MNIINSIQNAIQKVLLYIFHLLSLMIKRLRFVGGPIIMKDAWGDTVEYGESIPIEDKITDFLEVFKSTRIFLIFNMLALLVFIALPQGKDIILIVIEELSSFNFSSLISLLIGLVGWSIISEFGARYKVYVTDNSGIALSDERVNFRKEVQRTVSIFYLLLPTLIVMMSVTIVSLKNIKNWDYKYIWPFVIVLILLILTFAGLSRFYLDGTFINKLRNKNVWYKVSENELKWIDKLYGIYNDHVLMVRKTENFVDKDDPEDKKLKQTYKRFTDILESLPFNDGNKNKTKEIIETGFIETFPRDYIIEDELAPIDFQPVSYRPKNFEPDFTNEKEFTWKEKADGYYRWVYKNNSSFYKTLHLQVKVIAISSLSILLVISAEFLVSYDFIGSPALVCLSFGCWLGLYTGLVYLDSRYKRNVHISIRWLLFAWFFIVSFINNDHPVRINAVHCCNSRPSLEQHFMQWLTIHNKDTSALWLADSTYTTIDSSANYVIDTITHLSDKKALVIDSIIRRNDSPRLQYDTTKSYPVFFITAEGGALRTGAFTALLLARLQDTYPQFKNNIYAFSSVSGGSVGISFFNAISYIAPDTTDKIAKYNEVVTKKFFSQDQLSPVIGKMFYADLLNDFWPWHINAFDRAIVLEKAWEHSYAEVFKKPADVNVFSKNFTSCYQQRVLPAWFINTTEVETGLQCYISNVVADQFLFSSQRDLLSDKIKGGINYSTAINFSSRFPLFSPSAALYQNDDQTYHYVDGGYVENTGAKTMLEVLQSLHSLLTTNRIRPYVIQLRFGDSSNFEKTGFLNEITSITSGIYNTRAGSSNTYAELLKRETNSLHGHLITVPLNASSNDVPMSWVFSQRSLDNLNKVVDSIIVDSKNDLHKYLPYLQKDIHKKI